MGRVAKILVFKNDMEEMVGGKRYFARLLLGGVIGVALAGVWSAPAYAVLDKAREAGLAPHKALYDIRMAKNKSGSQILNISGQMMYEWQPSCDAWVSNHKFNLVYEYADGPPMRITSDFSTYESFDGKTLDFSSRRKRNGVLFDEVRGRAVSGGTGGLSEAAYTVPRDLSFDLPSGTLFPMGHTLSVLRKIREGKKFYNATIFDGSDEEGPVEINSFIGEPVRALEWIEPAEDLDQSLVDTPAWKVRLAFFPLNTEESAADYEMSLIFHENGIVSDMVIEYKDFSVSQRLVALERLGDACHSGEMGPEKGQKP